MGWGLVANLGLKGLRAASTLPGATALTAASVGLPVMMGAEDRKYELVQQGERGGKHSLSLTDRLFSPLTGINEQSVDAAKVAYLNDQLGPQAGKYGLEVGKDGNYFNASDTLAGAKVKVETAGEEYASNKRRKGSQQDAHDLYMSPQMVEERRVRDERWNQSLIQQAENKLEAEKIRQEGRAEQRELLAQQGIQNSEDRKLTLQLEGMRDKRAFDERRNNSQMAMVAALTASLGDLGDAFVSI
jgi:hypothetical protein